MLKYPKVNGNLKKNVFSSWRPSGKKKKKPTTKDFADSYPVPDWLINVTNSHLQCQNSPY